VDINAAWVELGLAIARGDRDDSREYAEAVRGWVDGGGFLPQGVSRAAVDARLAMVFDPYGDKRDGVK
jgi:hypothetical protein